MTIVLQALIIFFSSSVQGALSFGFSLIALPLLGLLMPLKTIVPALVVLSTIMNFIILVRLKTKPKLKPLLLILIMSVLFTPIGVYLLKWSDERMLKAAIGVVLILIAFAMKKGYRFKFKKPWIAYGIAGILSGIMNGAASLSGPPVVLLLSNEDKNKSTFRSSLTTLFLLLNFITLYLYYINGFFNRTDLKSQLLWIPILILGTLFGTIIGNKLNEDKFKKMVLNLLIVMGIMNLL